MYMYMHTHLKGDLERFPPKDGGVTFKIDGAFSLVKVEEEEMTLSCCNSLDAHVRIRSLSNLKTQLCCITIEKHV